MVADTTLPCSKVCARGNVSDKTSREAPFYMPPEGKTCMDEVKGSIQMEKFDIKYVDRNNEFRQITIEPQVVEELREYVKGIASNYLQNEFHNFDHAWYVQMIAFWGPCEKSVSNHFRHSFCPKPCYNVCQKTAAEDCDSRPVFES